MPDRYQPLRDVVAASSLPVGPTFPRILELLDDLLKERDELREALKPFAAIPLDQAGVGESFAEIVLHARGCLARHNGEETCPT